MVDRALKPAQDKPASSRPLGERTGFVVALAALIAIALLALLNLPTMGDYVGADNDDVMRLVQVRDLLAGQGWFDLTQYRLGLDGGTLMHWSRLIDLPIAALILLFSLFVSPEMAEMLAVLIWPMVLVIPLTLAVAIAAKRLGDIAALHVAMFLLVLFVITSNRFLPGAIDHHNVQLILIALMVAGLLDQDRRPSSFALTSVAAAGALAIGAETTPFVATVCAIVAALWAFHGPEIAVAIRAFSLTLLFSVSLLFFATVPPSAYSVVTCDTLSMGYYGLVSVGAGALFLATFVHPAHDIRIRIGTLAGIGILVMAAAVVIAPECLSSPLSNLDPLLVELWLNGVSEARSFAAMLKVEPGAIGGFYAVPIFAVAVCATRMVNRDRFEQHAILLVLLLVCLLIAFVQVRGAIFANLLAILPLSMLIAELRQRYRAEPEHLGMGFVFGLAAIVAVPSVWTLGGVMITEGERGLAERFKGVAGTSVAAGDAESCLPRDIARQLVLLPQTTIAAPSDLGAEILRFTPHRVLSAPYHRNQGGMLTELHLGLATPQEAVAFLRGADVGLVLFCASNPQTRILAGMKEDGLYAALTRGEVPPYLRPLPRNPASGLIVYQVNLR
ncbi:hypothetical protein FE840_006010 [Peteryoungia desertarenae]|uniref:Uncharacterized protein n=1 Tax=Peteryoungia desertarenae TaxID=1813451 RepID=A0ABX6QKQ8_9HYPH|nr:hypothetical protein [Peteryoungia desertarenae]QLF69125.1 hypothetical protein FE840_006010 [Peteryoungia desertarenae]